MPAPRPSQPLQIGDHVFDPALNELRRGGSVQRLPLRLADLLLRLAAEPGQVVRRETLLDEVWERRQVNDEVLSRAIADLRLAFDDDARAPRVIETLPKLGYRLVATVARAPAPRPGSEGSLPPTPPAPAGQPDLVPESGHGPVAATAVARTTRPGLRGRVALAALLLLGVAVLAGRWSARDARAPAVAASAPATAVALSAVRLLQARPFLGTPGREMFPRFTPDGRWVVYTQDGPTAPAAAAQVRLRAVDGTEDRPLVADAFDNYCGTVSPDGATLAWLRARPGTCELLYRPLLGGPARVLAGCGEGTLGGCPEWTPDGRALLLGGDGRDTAGLREIAFPDGSERVLTEPPAGQRDLMPRSAPDGASIVFWRGDAASRSLQRVARGGGAARAIRVPALLGFGHAFEPDGAVIAAEDSFGQRALVRYAEAAAPELLGGSDARHPDVSRAGALVYEVAHYDANLWRVALDAARAEPQQLTRAPRYDSQPAFAPDGDRIAFGSNRDGREGVYLMHADGSDERKLPLDPALRWTSPVWSPDGTALLVLRYDTQGARLCRHVLDGARTECPDTLAGDRHGAFFLSSDTIGMVDAETAEPRLWQLGFDGEPARALDTAGPVERCRATPRWLACRRPGQAGLWLRDRTTNATREVLPDLAAGTRAWTLAGDALYVPLATATPPGIYRFDLSDDTLQHVADLLPTAIGDALSVAPDGRSAVVARTDAVEVDLMYVPAAEDAAR